jgi:hypothetical protein
MTRDDGGKEEGRTRDMGEGGWNKGGPCSYPSLNTGRQLIRSASPVRIF